VRLTPDSGAVITRGSLPGGSTTGPPGSPRGGDGVHPEALPRSTPPTRMTVNEETALESASPARFQTIEQFILEQQSRFPEATGAFSRLIRDISLAAKIVSRDIRRAGLLDVTGSTGTVNVQGEVQQ